MIYQRWKAKWKILLAKDISAFRRQNYESILKNEEPSKFEWTLNNIWIKKILMSILATFFFFLRFQLYYILGIAQAAILCNIKQN